MLCAAAALAACDRPSPVADGAENAEALPPSTKAAPSPTGGPPPPENRVVTANAGEPASAIPTALHGRWGLTPADCTSNRGDAKGLLTISATELRFYESVAVPAADIEITADSFAGTFTFTGEGQSWSKFQRLGLRDDKLIRTERDPIASFRYVRCD